MRLLISADWQADWGCLPQCRQALTQVERLCKQHKIDAVIIAGDLKAAYDPVQIRVIKFWMYAIRRLRRLGIRVLVDLGNHDRIGMYTDAQNWLSILRRAGAETFDYPEVVEVGDGTVAMLPFTTSLNLLRKRAARLAKQGADVLVFHADVSECRYNALGEKSKSKISIADLYPERYAMVVGGHIHLPQKYYVGSPFCTEWGEANQRKRFLLYLDDKTVSVDSEVPGWFDESWPGFWKPKTWEGTHVRVHVDCEGVGQQANGIRREMARQQAVAQSLYPKAIINFIPRFESAGNQDGTRIDVSASDEDAIGQFVTKTLPNGFLFPNASSKCVAYLTHKIKAATRGRRIEGAQIRIESVEAKNVLSFKQVEWRFNRKGVTLVEGKNYDWQNQSNGAGKSNLMNLIAVAWFGTTFKGQKFNSWARQQCKLPAVVTLRMRDAAGNKISVVRGRRPTKLQLFVNGVDQSAGMNRGKKDGTQALIEQITGHTWQTLANSVYIDREATDAFLRGTKKERADLLYRFQNLERFEAALLLVRDDIRKHGVAVEQTQSALDMIEGQLSEARENLQHAKSDAQKSDDGMRAEYQKNLKVWRVLHTASLKAERASFRTQRTLEPKYKKLCALIAIKDSSANNLRAELAAIRPKLAEEEQFAAKGSCPTCGAPIDKKRAMNFVRGMREHVAMRKKLLQANEAKRLHLQEQTASLEAKIDAAKIAWGEAKNKEGIEYQSLRFLKSQLDAQRVHQKASVDDARKKLTRLKESKSEYTEYKASLEAEDGFLDYCEHALSRDGLPAFLIAQLAAPLTKAAEDYASLFADGEIQVRFASEGGGVEPQVVNIHGGDSLGDQSMGECGMASTICAFALREVASKTNLLILDEPGLGMTAHNLRMLARGLVKLKSQFESIYVVTHSPFLAGELSGERVIRVVKKNRISRLVQ